jgi:TPR repeat protein
MSWRGRVLILLGVAQWACAAAAAPSAEAPAAPPAKLALVIGNGGYAGGQLPNTRADADLIAGALRLAGFRVEQARDLSRAAMYDTVRRFAGGVTADATVVVYYAGHGMQINGANYLVPVDMTPTSEAGVALKAYPLSALHERLALAPSAVNMVILDACRNNPFQPAPAVRMRSYGALGLSPVAAPRGTLVAYSTAPGQLAEDGAGRKHSIYSETLAGLIGRSGLPVNELFRTLADQVRRRTLEDQQPWVESSLVGDAYFRPPPGLLYARAPARQAAPAAPGALTRHRSGDGAGSLGSEGDAAWYRHLDERGWTELDADLQRRAGGAGGVEMAELKRRAGKGNVVAMTTLGRIEQGCAAAARAACMRRARQWFQKAAELGFPVAQTELGELFFEGRDATKDLDAARRWLTLAAQANYPRARIDLAQLEMQQQASPEAVRKLLDTLMKSNQSMMAQPSR